MNEEFKVRGRPAGRNEGKIVAGNGMISLASMSLDTRSGKQSGCSFLTRLKRTVQTIRQSKAKRSRFY